MKPENYCRLTHLRKNGCKEKKCKHYPLCCPTKDELTEALAVAIKAVQALETLRAPYPPFTALRDKFITIAKYNLNPLPTKAKEAGK